MEYLRYINASIVGQLFLLGVLFFFRKSTNRQGDRLLGFLTIILGFVLLPGVLRNMNLLGSYWVFVDFDRYFGFAIAPTVYIYSRIIIDGRISNWRLRILHYIPAIFSTIYFSQIHFKPKEEILFYIDSLYQSINPSEGISIVIYFLHSLVYLFFGGLAIYRYYKRVQNKLQEIESFHIRWIVVLYIYLFLNNVFLLYFFALTKNSPEKYSFIVAFISLVFFYPFVLIVKYPMRFHMYFPGVKEELEKYKKSTISDKDLREKHQELINYLSSEKLYKDVDLNREILSNHLNITPNQLSQVISYGSFASFYDLINHFRVEESMSLLKDRNNSKNFSVEGIGKLAGFKSKSTFYSLFKKHTNYTPKEYMNLQQK